MKLVVWYVPKKKEYYHKLVKGQYTDYEVGYENQYGHKIVYTADGLYDYSYKIVYRLSWSVLLLSPIKFFIQSLYIVLKIILDFLEKLIKFY